ncbi:MAG: LysR family transcriptional regulator [Magnetococcales bacterium]|nr:LysR family transcriptional regulator [Magnetococcales bacterium]MBF0115120.1 LysR family transcriptional regulator [Magnetococcales bacterium]
MGFSDNRLRVFHAVAKHLSFTRAAEELDLTQPAITFQIRQLEDHFDTRLFDRHHNRITLTDAGKVALDYAERILELYHETEKSVHEMTGVTRGLIKLGASTTIGEYLLPTILSGYHERYPDVKVRMTVHNTSQVVRKLEDATIDLGMVEGPVVNNNLMVTRCKEDELVVILPPRSPLLQWQEIPLEQLAGVPFVSREEGSGTRAVVEAILAATKLPYGRLNLALELGSTEAVKVAVEGGVGFGIVSLTALNKELRLGTLVMRRIQGMHLMRQLNFIYPKQKFRSKAVEAFLHFASHHCGIAPEEIQTASS